MTAHIPLRLPLIPCSTGSYLMGRIEFHNNSYCVQGHTQLRSFHLRSRPVQKPQPFLHNISLVARDRTAPHIHTPSMGHSYYTGCPHNRYYLALPHYPPEISGNKHGLRKPGCSLHSNTDSRPAVCGKCFRNTRQRLGSYAGSLYHNRSSMGHVHKELHYNTSRNKLRTYLNYIIINLMITYNVMRSHGYFIFFENVNSWVERMGPLQNVLNVKELYLTKPANRFAPDVFAAFVHSSRVWVKWCFIVQP